MKYDPDIHEIVDVRHPKIGEQVIAMMGTLITVEGNSVGEPSCSGEWPIVRERVHDLAWAVAEMIRHPMVEYRGPELCHRWNPGGLFEYVFLGEWKPAEYFAKDEIASTEWHRVDAEPQPEPEPGSREAVLASPVGTCWWFMDARTSYRRRVGDGMEAINTLSGAVIRTIGPKEVGYRGYTPILDRNGNPAEPIVGSQLWADIVRHFPGVKVWHKNWRPDGPYIDGDEICGGPHASASSFWFVDPLFATGWSIYEPQPNLDPDPLTNESLAAEVHVLREEVRRLREKVEGA